MSDSLGPVHQEVMCSTAFVTDMNDLRPLEFHHSALGQRNEVGNGHFTDNPSRIGMNTQKKALVPTPHNKPASPFSCAFVGCQCLHSTVPETGHTKPQ
ncbi:hypothetical protein ALO55_100905 [Pseudomonas savastanoi pv. phaseolicola]|uniref:Uncharacterized protein n=1 Tax=Pseudomonas savastanoi pv. phaseolicola TaxID=319 RepID=A0ABD4BBN4_PSESH|nr:hypothetical protein ALO55_100905 [Pseudomonas savastanoi pv. phaseolicola]